MVYICDNCAFMFSQDEEPELCPDCGKNLVRPANAVEQEEFSARAAESAWSEFPSDFQPPDLTNAVLEEMNTFKFQMPVSDLGIDSHLQIEIVMEHGVDAADPEMILANAWVKLVGASFSKMLLTLQLPLKPNEPPAKRMRRIFEALTGTDLFFETLRNFVILLMEHED